MDWFTGPNKKEPLTKEIYDGFFSKFELDHQKKIIVDQKKTLFKDLFLEFEKEVRRSEVSMKTRTNNQNNFCMSSLLKPRNRSSA
jgi:hypothetical protein